MGTIVEVMVYGSAETISMNVNADFTKPVVVHAIGTDWIPSPMPGVERKMLDRIGEEVARATSIVRYRPNSRFSPHVHGGGEEFLVLEGVFQDEHGDYPAGFYVRNPPESRHIPRSDGGCIIIVKLWQFDPSDRTHVRIDAAKLPSLPVKDRPGASVQQLFRDSREDVRIERWVRAASIDLNPQGGIEIFVLDGSFDADGETFERWSWLRLPVGAPLRAVAGRNGVSVWIKEGHLSQPFSHFPR